MAESGNRIRITLRWIQILDNLEPFFKERGEFRFKSRITTSEGSHEVRFPEEGHYEISDHPAWNKLNLDKVLYEGEAGESMVVELFGEELDSFSANDHLDNYKREFSGSPEAWLGRYGPHDEDLGPDDPENLSNWRVCYDIERA